MPQQRWEVGYCYCSPPRYRLVTRYTWDERAMVAAAFVVNALTSPVVAFARWLTAPGATVKMVPSRPAPPPVTDPGPDLEPEDDERVPFHIYVPTPVRQAEPEPIVA